MQIRQSAKKFNKTILDKNGDGIVDCGELSFFLAQNLGHAWPLLEVETIYAFFEANGVFDHAQEYDILKNKIQSIKTFMMNDLFFNDAFVFEKVCLGVCEKFVSFDTPQDLDVVDILFCLDSLQNVAPFSKEIFEEEVMVYVAAEAFEEGLIVLPSGLSFAQVFLDKLNRNLSNLGSLKRSILKRVADPANLDENVLEDNQVIKLISIEKAVRNKKA